MKTFKQNVLVLLFALLTTQAAFAYYNPSAGRWLARDPIGEPGFQALLVAGQTSIRSTPPPSIGRWIIRDSAAGSTFLGGSIQGLSSKQIKQLKAESLMPAYEFVRNNPIDKFDADGRMVGIYCPLCWYKVRSELCSAQAGANSNVTDGSCHSAGTWCNGNCAPGTERDGSDADVLTHCIASCRLAQNPGSCMTPDDALRYLQARETPGSIDYRNNNAGNGVGINIGPKGDCVRGCVDAMNNGLLSRQ